ICRRKGLVPGSWVDGWGSPWPCTTIRIRPDRKKSAARRKGTCASPSGGARWITPGRGRWSGWGAADPKTPPFCSRTAGRADPTHAERLLAAGRRVLAVDLFYVGESRIRNRDYLFALLVSAVGKRPLGIQASQVAALARWSRSEHKHGAVTVVAVGPRSSLVALTAGGVEEEAIGQLELHGSLGSLKEVIEQNRTVEQTPEAFCFGLLEELDIKQLTALVAPRPVTFVNAGPRAKGELAGLKEWYKTLGKDFDPLR